MTHSFTAPQQVQEWLDELGPSEKQGKEGNNRKRGGPSRRRERHIADTAPPPTQTIKEKQDAVRAVASLGLGGAASTSPRRFESLSEQDSGRMKSLAPHRTQLMAFHESLQGHRIKSFETPRKNRVSSRERLVKHEQMACNDRRTDETKTGKAARTRMAAGENDAAARAP
ncbi:hypothetical protein NDU88_004221 [Pleurodeles waltl]|uniref:Uncharacterized protein n=1 Tax=Pleurodeles waltl TaxID=8319 RepID=A0AAV7RHL2_PLEWA|nr:hypothetical protein NDU88_004221 [Pleurodeles waltl]